MVWLARRPTKRRRAPTRRRRRARLTAAALEGPGWTGLTDPAEVIEARRLLMVQAERLMKPIDEFSIGRPGDPAALRSAATTLEPLLLALPHLFPPTTNLFDPAAHDPPTIALPTIWQRFAAFQTFAESAERAAAALAAADDGEPLRAASARMRAACDTCHAAFMKPYTPPKSPTTIATSTSSRCPHPNRRRLCP